MLIIAIIAFFDLSTITNGCLLRYDKASSSGYAQVSLDNISLNATGNYSTTLTTVNGQTIVTTDTTKPYGTWAIYNAQVLKGQKVGTVVTGSVSLCRAPLVTYNLGSDQNTNNAAQTIFLPRVEESSVNVDTYYSADPNILNYGMPLIFNAQNNGWRNIAFLELNDKIQITLRPTTSSSTTATYDIFNSANLVNLTMRWANCSQGLTSYDPICSLYSFYKGSYVSSCTVTRQATRPQVSSNCNGSYSESFTVECAGEAPPNCYRVLERDPIFGIPTRTTCSNWGTITQAVGSPVTSTMPAPYSASTTLPHASSTSALNSLVFPYSSAYCQTTYSDSTNCNTNPNTCESAADHSYNGPLQFWLINGNGLLWRLDGNVTPTNQYSMGGNYNVIPSLAPIDSNILIYNTTASSPQTSGYLQYMFFDNGNTPNSRGNNTGGYVLNIKQTKCVRYNGEGVQDAQGGMLTGQVEYVLIKDSGAAIDKASNSNGNIIDSGTLDVDKDGNAKGPIVAAADGYLAFRIINNPNFYTQSMGKYNLALTESTPIQSFGSLLNDLILTLKSKVLDAGLSIAKNLTCYKKYDTSSCTNFFTYITAMLSLYVITYGMMFLMGMVQISQKDLIIRLTKIALVAGLINGTTFEYFMFYIYPLITESTDCIISNIAGYAPFNSTYVDGANQASNPMLFLDNVMSNILFSKTFAAQLLATLSAGLIGVIYFFLICVSIGVFIVVSFKAICIYIMCFIGLAIMIAIAPLALTFLLFETTKSFFDNWINFVFRYIMEPVILMIGIILLTQLFSIYLDYSLGFSVCWKCAIPVTLPFENIPVLGTFFNQPVFCIYWFAPWGIDPSSYNISFGMNNIIALCMITYILNSYVIISLEVTSAICRAASRATAQGISMVDGAIDGTVNLLGGPEGRREANIKESITRIMKSPTENMTIDKKMQSPEQSKKI